MDLQKFERQLRLMMLLTQNTRYTVQDLAQQLEMTTRSIYRYLDAFKMAGFVVEKKGNCYRLDKSSPYFKNISELVHFTEEEALLLKQAVESLDGTSVVKQNLKKKLYNVYDYDILSKIVVQSGIGQNVHSLYEAIKTRRQVVLKGYRSAHSQQVSDRAVEPFAFTANNSEVWCYELKSTQNKLFKLSRIQSVAVLDTTWIYSDKHAQIWTDVFHISSDKRLPVTLRLGMVAASLLLEEFPLAESDLTQEDENRWILQTEVCRYEGVGRFVLGLFDDIEVLGSPEFIQYLQGKAKDLTLKMGL